MKILLQIGIIGLVCYLCEFCAKLLGLIPIGFPGSVLAMLLLFLCFLFKIIKPEALRETTDFLINNMAFFFVPSGVGIIKVLDVLKGSALQILLICIVSTVLTFFVTAYVTAAVIRLQNKLRGRKER